MTQGEILRNILAAMKQAAIGIDRKWNTWKVMDDDLDGLPTVTGKRAWTTIENDPLSSV